MPIVPSLSFIHYSNCPIITGEKLKKQRLSRKDLKTPVTTKDKKKIKAEKRKRLMETPLRDTAQVCSLAKGCIFCSGSSAEGRGARGGGG